MKYSTQKFFISMASVFAVLAISIEAALPPLYESLSEYKSLLSSQELASKLGSAEGIKDIKRTDKGFLVTTNKHSLAVDVVYDPQEHPGPAQFHFVFHDLEPVQE